MISLSTAQSEVVYAPVGKPIQVLASAGSGKTRVLTERVRYIIESTRKDGVIAFTFTNKAAEEMMKRLEGLEGIEERCWIATIHSIAQRILDQYGHTIGLPSELHIYERDQDRKTLFVQALRENGIDIDSFLDVPDEKIRKERENIIQNYMEQFSVVKRELLTEDEIIEKYKSDDNFWPMFQAYQDALLESGGIDYDDIIVYAQRILLEQPWCGQIYRAKYKHICVDEAQDLNRSQYEFIKALCGDDIKSLMMVGDPNQMIYGFNSSSQEYLCKFFIDDFSPCTFDLKENYRSSKSVIHYANKLKPGSQIHSEFALDGGATIQAMPDEKAEALWICSTIRNLLQLKYHKEIEGEISLNKMVVIARNRFVFKCLEECLKEHDISFSLKKGERHVEPSSTLGKVLDLGIRLRINPKDWVDGKKLCSVLKVKAPESWGDATLLRIIAEATRNSPVQYSDIQVDMLETIYSLDLDAPAIPKLCKDFARKIEDLCTGGEIEVDGELERSLLELNDFRRCWTIFKRKGLGESLSSFRNAMALGQLTEDYNIDGLTLSTVHTMKGLEKDIVFLMGMCEGVFPDYRATKQKEIDEERNNAFVAVTRSRRWIYITYPQQRKMPWGSLRSQAPSRFIREMTS